MVITVEIPQHFINIVKNSKVWKEETPGDWEAEISCMKRVFELFLNTLQAIGSGFEEEGVFQFIDNYEGEIYDAIYEGTTSL